MAAPCFHHFLELPQELQDQIWEHALADVVCDPFGPEPRFDGDSGGWTPVDATFLFWFQSIPMDSFGYEDRKSPLTNRKLKKLLKNRGLRYGGTKRP